MRRGLTGKVSTVLSGFICHENFNDKHNLLKSFVIAIKICYVTIDLIHIIFLLNFKIGLVLENFGKFGRFSKMRGNLKLLLHCCGMCSLLMFCSQNDINTNAAN